MPQKAEGDVSSNRGLEDASIQQINSQVQISGEGDPQQIWKHQHTSRL